MQNYERRLSNLEVLPKNHFEHVIYVVYLNNTLCFGRPDPNGFESKLSSHSLEKS